MFESIAIALGLAGQLFLGWNAIIAGDGMRFLLAFNLLLLCWRTGMRTHFTARWYGLGEAIFSAPRAFVANVIAMLAARRAVILYWRMLRSGEVVWDKTDHPRSELAYDDAFARRATR